MYVFLEKSFFMRIHSLSTALALVLTSSATLFGSDEIPEMTCAVPLSTAAMMTPHKQSSIEEWTQYLAQSAPASFMTNDALMGGMETFKAQGKLGEWIAGIGERALGPIHQDSPTYVTHLVHIVRIFAPKDPLPMTTLSGLFLDMESLPNAIRPYLHLINLYVCKETPDQQAIGGATLAAMSHAFETLSKHYVDRITSTQNEFTKAQALDIMGIIIAAYRTPFYVDLARRSGWDRVLLDIVATHTPALAPHEKDYINGFVRLAELESHLKKFENDTARQKDKARQITQDCTLPLSFEIGEDPKAQHAEWFFPLLARAYDTLEDKENCLKAWQEYEKFHPAHEGWSRRDLINALVHHCSFSDDPQKIQHWWDRYQKEASFDTASFFPSAYELNLMINITDTFSRLNRHGESVFLARKINAFLQDQEPRFTDPKARHHYTALRVMNALRLARSLTHLGQYEEAVQIYGTFFVWDQLGIYLHMGRASQEQEETLLSLDLSEDFEYASIALSQTGNIKQLTPKERLQQARNLKSADRRGGASAAMRAGRHSPGKSLSFADGAKAHLLAHYTKMIDSVKTHLKALEKRSQGLEVTAGFTKSLESYKSKVQTLKGELTKAASKALEKKNEPTTITELGKRIDGLRTPLRTLEKILEPLEQTRQAHRKKEIEAYLKSLSADEDDAATFALPTSFEPAQLPTGKEKTRGIAKLPAPAPENPTEQSAPQTAKATLLMKKKAASDYKKLEQDLQSKFHGFAAQISQNPYQVLGGLGRPKKLVSAQGIYFSRRLSDGDRVVYELIKGATGNVNVVFLSLLGHYENLERHKESTHVHPLVME
ncbi:MAG: hypothetical protein C0514_04075 [Candidatus Puniceispirillum sp.]|nr:hypothetical protein [Candidatus Puniceispirillum sp.]